MEPNPYEAPKIPSERAAAQPVPMRWLLLGALGAFIGARYELPFPMGSGEPMAIGAIAGCLLGALIDYRATRLLEKASLDEN